MKELIYQNFAEEGFDADGVLNKLELHCPDNFNFGFDVVDAVAEKSPNKPAMIWVPNDRSYDRVFTFDDMRRYSARTANYFKSLGIQKGDVVMLILKRNYQFWFSIVALHKLGAIVVPATNQLHKKDLVYRFNAAGVKAIICTSEGQTSFDVDEALKESPTVRVKVMTNGARDDWEDFDKRIAQYSDVFARPTGEEATKKSDIMLMYFTSGTTGYPKIAAHDFTYPIGHIVTARHWHNVDPAGIHFAVSDTGWGKAVWGKLYGQWLCETCVFVFDFERFHADEILSLIQKYKITTFCAPPTMYRFFIKEDLAKYDLSSLKHATIAGEALNPEVFYQFKQHTGLSLMEGFGQTETTLVVANLAGMTPKPGSMGKPTPQFDVDLLTTDGVPAQNGEVGEIVLHTDKGRPFGMFIQYYRDPVKTQEAWHDNIYHTGDMAWRDEDGYFWYVGRTDDLIKSSGYRIGPFEIESVLMEHPSVLECAVTAVPDPVRGQAVKATIVLARGYTASEELKKDIQNYVKKQTAPYKYPRVVEFVDELPKTISGKIRRVALRQNDK
ncbi:MAG: AMP-binding protein [Eubacteriales bacterium]|nr:AMP-binding protein [Eubacteriales bacterium]